MRVINKTIKMMSNGKLDRRKLVENAGWKESSDNQRSGKIYHQTCKFYQWELSVDGIVTALRYNAINSHFIAKLDYSKDGTEKMEEMIIPVEWVIDVYGHEIMSKLMERATYNGFVKCRPSSKKVKSYHCCI